MYNSGKTKLISLIMAVMMVISCVPAFAIGAVAEEEAVYYLQGGGEGDGTSAETPADSVATIIAQIEAAGRNVAGEEVVIKLIPGGSGYAYYNYDDGIVIPSHNATLVFESYDAETRSVLGVSPRKVGGTTLSRDHSQHLKLGGPVVFRGIGLLFGRTATDWLEMYYGGFDASFEDVIIYGYANETYTSIAAASSTNNAFALGAYDNSADGEGGTLKIDAATLANNSVGLVSSSTYAAKSYSDQHVFENDAKVVLGKGKVQTALRIGGSPDGNTVAYNKNLNIVLNGTEVTQLYSRNYIAAMTEGHALQIIYNDGATIASEYFKYGLNVPRYDIHVATGGALDTTAVAGTYTVTFPEGKTIAKATAEDGTEYVNVDNTLTVGAAGVYNVTFEAEQLEQPEPGIYYLKGGATGGTGAQSAPFGTISEVVSAAETAGLNKAGEEIIVKVIAPAEGENGNYGGEQALYFNPNSGWGPSSDDEWNALRGGKTNAKVIAHNATLVIESAVEGVRPLIWVSETEQDYFRVLRLGGSTVFRGVDLGFNRADGSASVFASGYDLELEDVMFRYNNEGNTVVDSSNVKVYGGVIQGNANGAGTGGGSKMIIDAATIARIGGRLSPLGDAVDFNWTGYNPISSMLSNQVTTKEVKFVLGAATLSKFDMSTVGGAEPTFAENVNVILNGTTIDSLYTSSSSITIADGKAVQFIYNNGASVTKDSGIGGLTRYDIHVAEGGALDTTTTAGTYTVTFPEGKDVAVATAADGTEYYSDGDTLTVGAAGTYNVEFPAEQPDAGIYYLKGGATGGTGAQSAPFGTIKEVVDAAEAAGLNKAGEEVIVKVIAPAEGENGNYGGEQALYFNPNSGWGPSSDDEWNALRGGKTNAKVIAHNATLVIESAVEGVRPLIWVSETEQDYFRVLRLGGSTVFRGVDLGFNRADGAGSVFASGYDLEFEDVIFRYNNEGNTEISSSNVRVYGGVIQGNANGAGTGGGSKMIIDAATIARIGGRLSPLGDAVDFNWTGYNPISSMLSNQVTTKEVKFVLGAATLSKFDMSTVGGAEPTFAENVNVILNGTTIDSLYTSSSSITIADGKAVQFIYNNGASVTKDSGIGGLTRYDIHVAEGGALDTTATAGTYTVTMPEGMKIAIATDAEGNVYTTNTNTLTVGEPGVYNVTFAKRIPGQAYYVQGGATGDGTSPETPAGTMAALIAQLNEDEVNVAGEEVVVKLMNGDGRFAYNYDNGAFAIIPHDATIIFEKYDEDTTAHLWATNHGGSRDESQFLRLGGPVVMRNISLRVERTYSDWVQLFANGNDWTLENVTFLGSGGEKLEGTNIMISHGSRNRDGSNLFNTGTGDGGTVIVDQATCNNNISSYLDIGGDNVGGETFTNEVKVVSGADYYGAGIRLGSGKTTKYMNNVNVVLYGTTAPSMPASGASFGDGAALQIIYNNGASITDTSAVSGFTKYEIFVENIEGAALDTTATAGTYAVTFPEDKSIVYYYAVDASGNYDGTTPVYYTTAETITVGAAGKYNVGFASAVDEIDVEIVNDFAEFDGWIHNEAAGTLTPAEAASNVINTDVASIDTIIYTANATISTGKKAVIAVNGDVAEKTVVELYDGGLKIGGYVVAGTFGTGTYGIKLTIAPASKALFVEITKPDGTVIRRGDDTMIGGNTAINTVIAKSSEENAVANINAVASTFVADSYAINETEPVLEGFEANVYNIITSYDVDGKTTRNFAFTAKTDFVAGATLAIRYAVAGSENYTIVDAVATTEYTNYSEVDFYEVDITGLTAGTTYNYQIGKKGSTDSSDWSGWYSFTTEPENASGFSFITIADTQGTLWNGDRGFMYAQAAINEALEDVENPAFILNAGDVVEGNSSSAGQGIDLEVMWGNYFKALGDAAKSIPHFAAMGNHDYQGHGSHKDFLFNLHFNHSNNGLATFPNWNLDSYYNNVLKAVDTNESTYSFDYDNTHFTVINTGPSGGTDPWYLGAQKSWITEDIQKSNAEWKVVVVHQPAYDKTGVSSVWNNDSYMIHELFESLGVDLVIEGHAHYNTRTYPMMGGEPARTTGNLDVIAKGEGTVYSIVGSTATDHNKLIDNLNEDYVSVFSPAAEMPVYAVVDVKDDSLTYTVKQLDGFIVDQFTIVKDDSHRTPSTVGVQIRIPTEENADIEQGLRFISSIEREAYDELVARGIAPETYDDKTVGFGSVIAPASYLEEGEVLTKNTEGAYVVPAVKLFSMDEDTVEFTVCLTNVPESAYTTDYVVIPYVTVMDGAEEITYYGEEMLTANVYQIAQLACGEGSTESEYTKQYLKTNVIDVVDAANNG